MAGQIDVKSDHSDIGMDPPPRVDGTPLVAPVAEAAVRGEAEALYRAGRFAEAAALLAPFEASDQTPAALLRIMGLSLLRLGERARAVSVLARAYAAAPTHPWVQLHYGLGLQECGRSAEAIALFRSAHTLLPNDPAPLLNLASALLTTGALDEALRAARKAELRAGQMPQAHYTLGLVYLAKGELARAETCFRQAVRLQENFSLAWLNLGVTYYRSNRMDAAKSAMRAALRADPDNQAAAANLGAFMRLTGEAEGGEALLRQNVARFPGNMAARINLAADLLKDDRHEEAMDILGNQPPQPPDLRQHWLLQRSLGLIKARRLNEARGLLEQLGPLKPSLQGLLLWRQVLLALEEGKLESARQTAEVLGQWLATAVDVLPEHRIMAHYDLAKFWSGMKNADRAFEQWTAGHRCMAQFQPFSRQRHQAFVDTTIERFDLNRLSRGPRAHNRDAAPVFVVGMPRSGTTLMEQILSAHGGIHGAGERPDLSRAFYHLGGDSDSAEAVSRVADTEVGVLDAVAEDYLARLHATSPSALRIVDKMPGNFQYLGLAALLMPGARIIACDRDPRDIGLSIFTYRFYGQHAYAHDLADLGWYIGQQQRLMRHWREVLPNPILTVRLSDWVQDFKGTLTRVLNFLDMPYDPACERFYELDREVRTVSRQQVRQPVNDKGIGRWRGFEKQLAPLFEALAEAGALPPA